MASQPQVTTPPENDAWVDVETEALVKFDTDGDTLIGRMLGWSESETGIAQAHFDTPEHGKVFVNCTWDLKRQLKQVKTGTLTKIIRIGTQDTGRDTPMTLFKVQTRK